MKSNPSAANGCRNIQACELTSAKVDFTMSLNYVCNNVHLKILQENKLINPGHDLGGLEGGGDFC